MFTYSHANTPLGQSERAYYLSNFIKLNSTRYGVYHLLILSERELKKVLRDTSTRRAAWMGPSNFWLVLSEHAHAGYPGLFFPPPGFSPYMGREERRAQGLDYYSTCSSSSCFWFSIFFNVSYIGSWILFSGKLYLIILNHLWLKVGWRREKFMRTC